MPTSRIVRLRFPDGDSEVRTLGKLHEGAVVRLRGASWVVASIEDDIVELVTQASESNGDGDAGDLPPAASDANPPMILDAPLTV